MTIIHIHPISGKKRKQKIILDLLHDFSSNNRVLWPCSYVFMTLRISCIRNLLKMARMSPRNIIWILRINLEPKFPRTNKLLRSRTLNAFGWLYYVFYVKLRIKTMLVFFYNFQIIVKGEFVTTSQKVIEKYYLGIWNKFEFKV